MVFLMSARRSTMYSTLSGATAIEDAGSRAGTVATMRESADMGTLHELRARGSDGFSRLAVEDLLPIDGNLLGGADADSHLVALNATNGHGNILPDAQDLSHTSCEDQHDEFSLLWTVVTQSIEKRAGGFELAALSPLEVRPRVGGPSIVIPKAVLPLELPLQPRRAVAILDAGLQFRHLSHTHSMVFDSPAE